MPLSPTDHSGVVVAAPRSTAPHGVSGEHHLHVGSDLGRRRPQHGDLYDPRAERRRQAATLVAALAAVDPRHRIASLRPPAPAGRSLAGAMAGPRHPIPRTGGANVLHLHVRMLDDLPRLATLPLGRTPIVVHLHETASRPTLDGIPSTLRHRLLGAPLEQRLLRRAQLVITTTRAAADLAVELGARHTVTVTPAPLPVAHGLPPTPPRPAPWLWGRRIVSVGSLHTRRRLDALVEALATQPTDTDLILLGEGPAEPALRRVADRLALGHRVHVQHRPTWEQVDAHLGHADVVATTALLGEGPFAVLRAMQLGRPVLATDVDERRRFVSSGVDGLLVQHADPWALAGGLRRLLTDVPLAQELGAAAARRTAARTWRDVAAEIVAALEERPGASAQM